MNDHLWDAGGEYLSKNVKSLCVYQSVTAEHMSLFAKFQYWGIHQHQRIGWDRENIMTKTIQQSLSKAQQNRLRSRLIIHEQITISVFGKCESKASFIDFG